MTFAFQASFALRAILVLQKSLALRASFIAANGCKLSAPLGGWTAWKLGCCFPLTAVGYPPTLVSPSNPRTLPLKQIHLKQIGNGCCKHRCIGSIQNPTMTGKNPAGILDLCHTLEPGFKQIAHLTHDAQ